MIVKTRAVSRVSLIAIAFAACCTTTARADAPEFGQSSYSFAVTLNQTIPYVGAVTAHDPDGGQVGYVLHGGGGDFWIDSNYGYIIANLGALDPGTYSMTVEAVDMFNESSFADVTVVVNAGPPPVITNVNVYRMSGNMCVVSGNVNSSTPGGVVNFGGVLNGKSVNYSQFGSFSLWTTIAGPGLVTLQAVDQNGQSSAVVQQYVQ